MQNKLRWDPEEDMDRLTAFKLLDECTGHDIWSVDECRSKRVPAAWIEELADAFESSFFDERQTIYVGQDRVNQFHGVHDLRLAFKLAEYLGIDVERYRNMYSERGALVRALKEAAEDD